MERHKDYYSGNNTRNAEHLQNSVLLNSFSYVVTNHLSRTKNREDLIKVNMKWLLQNIYS